MKQIQRISLILQELRKNKSSIVNLHFLIQSQRCTVSLRQVQRDLKDVSLFLHPTEELKSIKQNKKILYYVSNNSDYKKIQPVSESNFYQTYTTENTNQHLKIIEEALISGKSIFIENVRNDETGDNADFQSTKFRFQPVKLIFHRGNYYVGGWNPKRRKIQLFGINQIDKIYPTMLSFDVKKVNDEFEIEFHKRFGVTKNINEEVYDIKIEFSSVLYEFIKNHFWHKSQKTYKANNQYFLTLTCGINRELLGWLFQWMYNLRVIEPPILKEYYAKALIETKKNSETKAPLIYRNIFQNSF